MEASQPVQWRNMFHVCVGADSYVSCYLMKDLASDLLPFVHFPSHSSVQARPDLFFHISLFIFHVFFHPSRKTSIQFLSLILPVGPGWSWVYHQSVGGGFGDVAGAGAH